MAEDKIWISNCSAHHKKNYECSMCKSGYYISQKELGEEQELFTNNYPEWYKQHNNGIEPDESALEIWRTIVEKEK